MVVTAQQCESTKCHSIVHFKWVNFICETFFFNRRTGQPPSLRARGDVGFYSIKRLLLGLPWWSSG